MWNRRIQFPDTCPFDMSFRVSERVSKQMIEKMKAAELCIWPLRSGKWVDKASELLACPTCVWPRTGSAQWAVLHGLTVVGWADLKFYTSSPTFHDQKEFLRTFIGIMDCTIILLICPYSKSQQVTIIEDQEQKKGFESSANDGQFAFKRRFLALSVQKLWKLE